MHLKKSLAVTLFATVALMATNAQAQPSFDQFENVTVIEDPLPSLEGWVTNQLTIDFTGLLTGFQMWAEGDVELYNEPALGSATLGPGAAATFPAFPELQYDSFVTFGGFTQGDSLPANVLGGAANIGQIPGFEGADTPIAFGGTGSPATADGLNIGSSTPAGNAPDGGTNYPVAQLTFSNTSNGTLHIFASAGGLGFDGTPLDPPSPGHIMSIPILNGVVGIPEPSTFVLLGIGLVGLIALKRRNG